MAGLGQTETIIGQSRKTAQRRQVQTLQGTNTIVWGGSEGDIRDDAAKALRPTPSKATITI
jgi:hypothetical protein